MVYSTLARSIYWNVLEYTGIYRNMVCWTLVWSDIPEYGLFDLGKVEYTGICYIDVMLIRTYIYFSGQTFLEPAYIVL